MPRVVCCALFAIAGCAPAVGGGGGGDTGAPGVGPGDDGGDGTDPQPPGACGLSHDLAQPYFSEGDTIAFALACAEPRSAGTTFTVLGAGPDATLDPATGAFSWTTDGGDGGRVELTLAAEAPGSGRPPETATLTLWIADQPDAPGAQPPDPAAYTEEWGLPVVHIEADGALTEADRPATLTVRGRSFEGSAKVRGASSVYYPKQSYTLDFGDEEVEIEEWGARSRGHLVLTSPFDDNSGFRQKLIFDLWAAMAEALGASRMTPRTFFTVVYLNGEYRGLYLGCDRIDDEFARHMGFGGEGDLYKSISHDANFALTDSRGAPKGDLAVGWVKKEGADEADLTSLRELVAFTGAADPERLQDEGPGWIDLDEFIDWQLLIVFSQSQDSAGKNAHLYQDEATGRFRFTPWDFNASWGQNWYTLRLSPADIDDYHNRNRVFALLNGHPDGWARTQARYATLRDGGPLDPAWLANRIDGYVEVIGPSRDRDWARWGDAYRSYDRWTTPRSAAGDWTDPAGERAYIEGWIADRADAMDAWVAGD